MCINGSNTLQLKRLILFKTKKYDDTKTKIESLENKKESNIRSKKLDKKFIIDMFNMSTTSFDASIYFNSKIILDFSPGFFPNFCFVTLRICI